METLIPRPNVLPAGALALARKICSFDPHPDRIRHVAADVDLAVQDLIDALREIECFPNNDPNHTNAACKMVAQKALRRWRLVTGGR